MALISEDSTCSLCDQLLDSREKIVAWSHFISDRSDPLWRFSDSAMHQKCFLSWPYREEFRSRQNIDYKRVVYPDQTVSQMREDGLVVRVSLLSEDNSQAWFAQMYYSSILAHLSLLATAKAIEGKDEIILDDLEPQISAHDFLEILIFISFCNGMFSRIGVTPARNFVLDSTYLIYGNYVLQIHGAGAASQYEKIRSTRVTQYMNQVSKVQSEASPKLGQVISSLVSSFEKNVIRRPIPLLAPAILGLLAADEVAAKRNPRSLTAMRVDLGRNSDPKSIHKLQEQISLADRNPAHITETHALFSHYLDN